MLRRISSIGLEDGSISGRVAGARAGLLAFVEKPILGWGPENFMIAWAKYVDAEAATHDRFDQAHNKLVEELTTKGTFGFVSYMLVWAAMTWAMFRSIRRRQGYAQLSVVILAAAMLAYFMQNLFLFDTPVTLMQFSILAAFAVAQEFWVGERDQSPARSWLPQRFRNKLNLRPVSAALRTSWGAVCLMALVSVVIMVALYALNLRAYNAATEIANFSFATRGGVAWEERIVYVEESVTGFPGLANYPRRYLLVESFNTLNSTSDDEFWSTIELTENTGADALKVEPDNWRIIALLTHLHQVAGERDVEHVKIAKEYLDKMTQVAPNLPDTHTLTKQQESLEQRTAAP